MYDLANVLTKFLYLGLSLDETIAKVTSIPAQTLLLEKKIGTLAAGAWGDAAIFELRQGKFQLLDAHGEARSGSQSLAPVAVVKGGQLYRQTG